VKHMRAGQHMSRCTRRKNILVANRAVVARTASAANMNRTRSHAHVAGITVHVVIATAHAAKSAAIAVKLLSVHIVVEAADLAEVGRPERDGAVGAGGGHGLMQTATAALYGLNGLPVYIGEGRPTGVTIN
jgi:hypothetical protein